MESQTHWMTLNSGRYLGYAEYGDPAGRPYFYHHGWPGSRFEGRLLHEAAVALEIRVLATERPGYGISAPRSDRHLIDWPEDLSQLADHLGIEDFTVIGVSGGGPYALAAAWRFPHRVRLAVLICPLGSIHRDGIPKEMMPQNRALLIIARRAPWLGGMILRYAAARIRRDATTFTRMILRNPLCAKDRAALRQEGFSAPLGASMSEAFRGGIAGALSDGRCYVRPWGFDPEEIQTPVHLWHGESDVIVPAAMSRCQAGRLIDCKASFLPGEGHFSLPQRHLHQILQKSLE